MTQEQHPITPPPELVRQWLGDYFGTTVTGEVSGVEAALATQAARWSADMELEACCKWMIKRGMSLDSSDLRTARRPKPTLAKRALHILGSHGDLSPAEHDRIRRALEQLDD